MKTLALLLGWLWLAGGPGAEGAPEVWVRLEGRLYRPEELPAWIRTPRLSLEGRSPAPGRVELWREGEALGWSATDGQGRFYFLEVPLLEGPQSLEVRFPQGPSVSLSLRVDSTPPMVHWPPLPSALPPQQREYPLSLRTEPHLPYRVLREEEVVAQGVADEEGWLSVSLPLRPGSNLFRVRVWDEAGNVAEHPLRLLVDAFAPPLAVLNWPAQARTANEAIRLEVQTEPGAYLFLERDGVPLAEWEARESRTTVNVPLREGPNLLRLIARDPVGNASLAELQVEYRPDAFPLRITVPERTLLSQRSVALGGETLPGAELELALPDGSLLRSCADPQGHFALPAVPLMEGENLLSLRGRRGAWIGEWTLAFQVDTQPPPLEVLSPREGALFAQAEALVRVHTEAGARLSIAVGSKEVLQVEVAGEEWEGKIPLAEGENQLFLQTADAAGNVTQASLKVRVDTRPPPLALLQPSPALVREKKVPIAVRTEPEASVMAWWNGYPLPSRRADGEGKVLWEEVALQEGENLLALQAEDPAGHRSEAQFVVRRDTVPPRLEVEEPGEGFATRSTILSVRGTTEPGAVVEVHVGEKLWQRQPCPQGDFLFPRLVLSEGRYRLLVVARDGAGNERRVERWVTVDTTPPIVEILSPPSDAVLGSVRMTLQGRGEPGSEVRLFLNGSPAGQMEVPSDGLFQFPNLPLPLVVNRIEVMAIDKVGNTYLVRQQVKVDDFIQALRRQGFSDELIEASLRTRRP